jgi:hypothetical protein
MSSVEPFQTVPAHQQRQHGLTLSIQGIIQIKCTKKIPWLTTKTPSPLQGPADVYSQNRMIYKHRVN